MAGAQQAAHEGSAAKTFAGHDVTIAALQPTGTRSFNDVLADSNAAPSKSDSQAATGVTPAIPEPQTYALLLAGLGAVVFVAVRRRQP